MERFKSRLIKASYINIVVTIFSCLLLILNMTYIQSAIVQYIGLVGIGLSAGFVMFLMLICVYCFVKGFRDMINHGWL